MGWIIGMAIFCLLFFIAEHPWTLLIIIPLAILALYLLLRGDPEKKKENAEKAKEYEKLLIKDLEDAKVLAKRHSSWEFIAAKVVLDEKRCVGVQVQTEGRVSVREMDEVLTKEHFWQWKVKESDGYKWFVPITSYSYPYGGDILEKNIRELIKTKHPEWKLENAFTNQNVRIILSLK